VRSIGGPLRGRPLAAEQLLSTQFVNFTDVSIPDCQILGLVTSDCSLQDSSNCVRKSTRFAEDESARPQPRRHAGRIGRRRATRSAPDRNSGGVRGPRGGLGVFIRAAEATTAAAMGQRECDAGVSEGVASAAIAVRAVPPHRGELLLP
jgi:hypothetical protein